MAQAQRKTNRQADAAHDPVASAEQLRGVIGTASLAATNFLPRSKVEATVAQWLAGIDPPEDADEFVRLYGDAIVMAMAVALFQPSLSGKTAVDRYARQHDKAGADERQAIEAMRQSRFRLIGLEQFRPPGGFRVRDLVTGEVLHLVDGEIPQACAGQAIAARLCPIEGDIVVPVGPITPLDDALLLLARQSIRPDGRGLAAQRCAETLYRHVTRHGAPRVPGLNAPSDATPGFFPYDPDDGPLHALAFALARSGAEPSAAERQRVREHSRADDILEAITGLAAARLLGPEALAAAYESLALIQMEAASRRAACGLADALRAVAAGVDRGIAEGSLPNSARELLAELRRRVRVATPDRKASSVELDKVLARIQALRAKTVATGCTEQEALAAAEKVAELLDRYGLSLSETELRSQACEGSGVGTGRKRFGPIDLCIGAVGLFCDCRVWSEQAAGGEISYVFFGLPADVAAARYLYDLVDQAFETETQRFKSGELYALHPSAERRGATNSFQTGLAQGISRKLRTLHAERETAMRTTTGRDLVPIKAAVLDEELARLGMSFHTRNIQKNKRVLAEAFHAGRAAGDRFEVRPGIEAAA